MSNLPARAQESLLRNVLGDESTRWKDVTLKIMGGSGDEITVPLMQATTVHDVKRMLAEVVTVSTANIDLYEKMGCKFRRLRQCDEIPTKVLVKGLTEFARPKAQYPHPTAIIGGGHLGVRQALRFQREGWDYILFERKARLGGNAWNGIANKWSKLQSEAPHYHLNWDAFDGAKHCLLPISKYPIWPSRDQIIEHFYEVVNDWNLWPNMRMSTHVTDMEFIPQRPGQPEEMKAYTLKHESCGLKFDKRGPNEIYDDTEPVKEGYFTCSCLTFYPGALAVPHRKTWPGEEVFGGQIGYGFNDEFDYDLVKNQNGIVIGMGAFAVENVRTLVEHDCKKFYVIARHHNLLLPRVISWYINQSRMPPPAATILRTLEPMYKYYGADVWSYFSVTTNADRSTASIKQYTRWGIGDIYFLAVYYDKCETVEGEVKRMKHRTAVISTGRVLSDIDHMIKVLGFDSDFGVDKIMKTKATVGFWPDGDYRRWTASDQSAIDASRFGGTAIAPYASTVTFWPIHFFTYPMDARRLIENGLFVPNKAKPELGSASYHYDPRTAASIQVTYGSSYPEITDWGALNDMFKKGSMWHLAPPEVFVELCRNDWYGYCERFKKLGDDRPFPEYPYDVPYVYELLRLEEEDALKTGEAGNKLQEKKAKEDLKRAQEEQDRKVGAKTISSGAEQPAQPAQPEQSQAVTPVSRAPAPIRSSPPVSLVKVLPSSDTAFIPFKHVMQQRMRSISPGTRDKLQQWSAEGNYIRDMILQKAAEM